MRDFAAAKAPCRRSTSATRWRSPRGSPRLPEVPAIERERFAAVLLDEYQDTGHAQIETAARPVRRRAPGHRRRRPVPVDLRLARRERRQHRRASRDRSRRPTARRRRCSRWPTSFRNDRVDPATPRTRSPPPLRTGRRHRGRAAPGAGCRAGRGRAGAHRDRRGRGALGRRAAARALGRRCRPASAPRRCWSAAARRSRCWPRRCTAAGLPVEIVGLGGLLTTPEVVDVVATLRVLADHDAGAVAGPAAHRCAVADRTARPRRAARPRARLARPPGERRPAGRSAGDAEPLSLVEALDDLGPAAAVLADGLPPDDRAGASELRRLRRRISAPLPELVAEVERAIGVDIEVAARRRPRRGRPRAPRPVPRRGGRLRGRGRRGERCRAFLAYLDAAEDEENGLEAGEIVVDAERVQMLTVHGAKGLEWDVVAVPGLVDGRVPGRATRRSTGRGPGTSCPSRCAATAPTCPRCRWPARPTASRSRDLLDRHHDAVSRTARRARSGGSPTSPLTRARRLLLASGYVWDTTQQAARTPSPFLTDAACRAPSRRRVVRARAGRRRTRSPPRRAPRMWPLDPLGPFPGDRGAGPPRRGRARRRAGARRGRPTVLADRGCGRPRGRAVAPRRRPAARRARPAARGGTRSTSSCPPTCRCRSWSSSSATRTSSPAACAGRCRADRRRGRGAAPRSTAGSSSAGRRRPCSTSTSCPAPPTTGAADADFDDAARGVRTQRRGRTARRPRSRCRSR